MTDPRQIQLIMTLRGQGIADARVLDAIERTPREAFVDAPFEAAAYDNSALPIACLASSLASILMTLAPQSASCRAAVGPARATVSSSTVKRDSGALVGRVPGDDFSIEDGWFVNLLEGFDQFGKAFADILAIAREEGYASGLIWIAAVQLGAHAVVLVFEEGANGAGLRIVVNRSSPGDIGLIRIGRAGAISTWCCQIRSVLAAPMRRWCSAAPIER